MKLSKTYSGKFFKKHVVEKAIQSWLEHHDADLLSSEFLILDIELDDEETSYDSFEEFLEEYSLDKSSITLSIRLPNTAATFRLSYRHGSTHVSIGSKDRHMIRSVISDFDGSNENSDYVNISRPSYNEKDVKPADPNLYKEERRNEIDLRVIKSDDLIELATQIFSSNYDDANEECEQTISLKWNDGSSWQASSLSAVSAELENARKKLISIDLHSYRFENRATISCRLTHENQGLGSELVVSGYDRQWVSEVYLRLSELIQSFEPQKKIPIGTDFIVPIGLGVLVGFTFSRAASHVNAFFLSTVNGNGNEDHWVSVFTSILAFPIGMIVGLSGGAFLSNYIRSAYPRIELQVGPIHQSLSAKRRKLIWTTVTSFGIPVLLQFFL